MLYFGLCSLMRLASRISACASPCTKNSPSVVRLAAGSLSATANQTSEGRSRLGDIEGVRETNVCQAERTEDNASENKSVLALVEKLQTVGRKRGTRCSSPQRGSERRAQSGRADSTVEPRAEEHELYPSGHTRGGREARRAPTRIDQQ